jgi:hypothetical protein
MALGREPGGGLAVMVDVFTVVHRAAIILAVARNNIPAVYALSVFVRDGGWRCVSTTGVGASRLPNSHADRNESARKLPGRIFIWASRPIHGFSGDLATSSSIRLTNSWDRSTVSWLSRIRSLRSACAQCRTARVSGQGCVPWRQRSPARTREQALNKMRRRQAMKGRKPRCGHSPFDGRGWSECRTVLPLRTSNCSSNLSRSSRCNTLCSPARVTFSR